MVKSKEYTDTKPQLAAIGMITHAEFIAAVSRVWPKHGGLFGSPYLDLIGKWCVEHHRRYGKPIGRHIETRYSEWAAHSTDKGTLDVIERLLEHLSNEYEHADDPTPTQIYIDAIVDIVDRRRFQAIRDEIEVMNGSTDDARATVLGFRSLRDELNIHAKGLVSAASTGIRRVSWISPWLPRGAIIAFDGDPGMGKSTIALDYAARITRGHLLPPHPRKPSTGRDQTAPGNVIYLSGEDDAATTLTPRLVAADGDLSRVMLYGTESERITFPSGMPQLTRWVDEYRPSLIVIDPIYAFLDAKIDANNDPKLRTVLAPLAALAQSSGAAMLLLRHLNKKEDNKAMYRGGGSIALTAQARVAWLVGHDPNDRDICILATTKANLGPPPTPLAYRIEGKTVEADDGEDCPTSRIEWLGERDDVDAQHILVTKRQQGRPTKINDVIECMRELLSNGKRMPSKELLAAVCERCDVSKKTVENARKQAKVQRTKDSFTGGWLCFLSDD
jgi:hypothetical protein